MTTEVAEQVAAPVAPTTVVAPAPTEPSQVQTPEPAAPSEPEAADVEELDAELTSFLKESGHLAPLAEGSAGEGAAVASEVELPPEIKAARAEGAADKEREIASRQTAQEQAAQREGLRRAYAERLDRLDNLVEEVNQGNLSLPDLRKAIKAEFSYDRGQTLQLAGFAREEIEAAVQQAQALSYGQALYAEAQKVLPKEAAEAFSKEPHAVLADFFKSFLANARKGYLSPAEAEKKAKAAAQGVVTFYKQKGLTPSSKAVNAAQGGVNTTGGIVPQSSAEADEMFAGTHASGQKITLAQLRTYRAQFQRR